MLESLNKYGLAKKYAIIGLIAGIGGALLVWVLGFDSAGASLLIYPLSGTVGGYVGGPRRQKKDGRLVAATGGSLSGRPAIPSVLGKFAAPPFLIGGRAFDGRSRRNSDRQPRPET